MFSKTSEDTQGSLTDCIKSCEEAKMYTAKIRKSEVLGTRDFISKYWKFEL